MNKLETILVWATLLLAKIMVVVYIFGKGVVRP